MYFIEIRSRWPAEREVGEPLEGDRGQDTEPAWRWTGGDWEGSRIGMRWEGDSAGM